MTPRRVFLYKWLVVRLRTQILLFLFLFGLAPLMAAFFVNVPLVLDVTEHFYYRAHLQNLRADFRDLDQHLASRHEMVRLLAKLPEPGLLMGDKADAAGISIDEARTRYAQWINRILADQFDIIQILFLDADGREGFWLERNPESLLLEPSLDLADRPADEFLGAAMELPQGEVVVGPISVKREVSADDATGLMTLRLIGPVISAAHAGQPRDRPLGAVMLSIDVGGMAQAYRDTYWVHSDGSYLGLAPARSPARTSAATAYEDFPGLRDIFARSELALWENAGEQVLWVPLFATEDAGPLWVGRAVDPSPLRDFRLALELRVIGIVAGLAVIVLLMARWFAVRAERFGAELSNGITQVVEKDTPVHFAWRGPRELRALGANLSRLTERHVRNVQAMEAHARELEASSRYKSEFLANVSHELRTPLNSILLLSKMLAEHPEGGESDERLQQARVIHKAGADLAALIDNILDLSRIEARKAVMDVAATDLPELLGELIELLRPQFTEKGLTLDLRVEAGAPESVVSDREKIRQILKNFLANAVKFTREGGVTVILAAHRDADAERFALRISVSDTGIGIPADQQEAVFEAFQQADGSTRRRYGGTGLGLTISRELALLIGGEIQVESAEGKGATFSLLLPRAFDAQQVAAERVEIRRSKLPQPYAAKVQADFGGCRVLLVDDDLKTLLALTPLLESWGCVVTGAGDSGEALDALSEEAGFDIVLMEFMMPGMDGKEMLQRMRADAPRTGVSVVALCAVEGDAEAACGDGMGPDAVLHKPVDPVALKGVLIDLLASGGGSAA